MNKNSVGAEGLEKWCYRIDLSQPGLAPMVDFCEKCDEHFGSIKARNCTRDVSGQ
jgi:hypothetical protein